MFHRSQIDVKRRAQMDIEGVDDEYEYEEWVIGDSRRAKRFRMGLRKKSKPVDIIDDSSSNECQDEKEALRVGEEKEQGKIGKVGVHDENLTSDIDEEGSLIEKGAGEISSEDGEERHDTVNVDAVNAIPRKAKNAKGDVSVTKASNFNLSGMETCESDMMFKALSDEERNEFVVKEFRRKIGRDTINVYRADFEKVVENRWLSDNVMDAFIVRLRERCAACNQNYLLLPVHFMVLLRSSKKTMSNGSTRSVYNYDKVRSYFKNDGILLTETASVYAPTPLHGCHWILIVLHLRRRTMLLYDPMSTSMHPVTKSIITDLKRWVRDEVGTIFGLEEAE